MLMRKKPVRGEKVMFVPSQFQVTLLEVVEKDFVKAIFPDGKIQAVAKTTLALPIIDTRAYEKLDRGV
jgi:hypothetical protein